jgi:uncharacterized protein YciI
MYYLFYCEDAPDSFEKRRSVRQAHLEHLNELVKDNRLLLAGPCYAPEALELIPYSVRGSLIVAEFNNIEDAKAWIAADPYATAQVFANITVKPFTKTLP